ncbi:MAG: hypothetical protein KDK41_17850 [Leptospiraceae bacterium]|nr:hypothetical protein [Leptospiraceae bacterium]MCB1202510.1 hypothetical protein [Leptospiraceae bacterium]
MKKIIMSCLIFVFALGAQVVPPGSDNNPEPHEPGQKKNEPTILFYGSDQCGICQSFFSNMKDEKIAYTFINVRKDRKGNNEMWEKVFKVNPDARSVRFPVIDIDGKVLVSPNYKTFKAALSQK